MIYIFIFMTSIAFAQIPKPAEAQKEPIAIVGGTIHVGNGEVIENGVITFSDGKIDGVGTDLSTEGYQVIEAKNQHVYPGLILPATNLGLEDIAAVRASVDDTEIGAITPNVRSQIAYNTDSEIIPTFRFNGILLAQIAPRGGYITGTSTIMELDGWNWEDATYERDDAVHLNWPSKTFGPRWWQGETERRTNKNYDEQVKSIITTIRDAKAYLEDFSKMNLKLEAMKGVLEGSQALFVYADRAEELIASITTLKKEGIEKLVIVGGRDSYYVKDLLLDHDIPVVLDNIHRMPSRPGEHVNFPFQLPGLLSEAGVKVALRHEGMLSRGRNLPFYAGTAAAHGMNKEDALSLITKNAADILGIGDRAGTLEAGKDAHILVSDGDLLEMRESIIDAAFISGRKLNLDGKQQLLYERFKEKYSK